MSTYLSSAAIDPDEWITQAEAARLRHVTRQAIAKLVNGRRLRTLTVGGRTFVSRADVVAFEPNPAGRPRGASHE
jgi:hypothetical protein